MVNAIEGCTEDSGVDCNSRLTSNLIPQWIASGNSTRRLAFAVEEIIPKSPFDDSVGEVKVGEGGRELSGYEKAYWQFRADVGVE
jgi:hypothetical protein